jgi:hypothetical protein
MIEKVLTKLPHRGQDFVALVALVLLLFSAEPLALVRLNVALKREKTFGVAQNQLQLQLTVPAVPLR